MSKKRIVIAGGGTGGHIYPGLAIAQALRDLAPDVEVVFVGAQGGLEERIVPEAGFPLHLIKVGKLHESVGRKEQIKTLLGLPLALIHCLTLVVKLNPHSVLGVGGFASGPFVLMASLMGKRTYLWEPNAQPGWTNRILAKFVKESLLVFRKAGEILGTKRMRIVGLPVRKEIRERAQKTPPHNPLRVLVFGGSQGAKSINDVVMQAQIHRPEFWQDIHLVHQAGAKDFGRVKKHYENHPGRGQREVLAYLNDMPERLAWADVVVCRAGASTVAEICAAGKPAIFIPFPFAADDHQRKNAEALVEAGAAIMILQQNLTPEVLMENLDQFRVKPELIGQFQTRLAQFDRPESGLEIAELLLKESV